MKILQIINSHALQDGGAQRLALEMHRSYLEQGQDSHLLSLMRSPIDEPNTYSLGVMSPYQQNVWPKLLRFLSQPKWKDVDIIHVHLFPAQIWVAAAMSRMGWKVPLITTEHNTFNRRRNSFLGRALDFFTLKKYQLIICISPATMEALAHWQPKIAPKLVTIANGIDLTRYRQSGSKDFDPQIPIVIAVGRISEQKNYSTAIEAIHLLRNREFQFWIVGQDELNGQIHQQVLKLALANHVHFCGYQPDVPGLLERADIFLLTSRWEGFGLAVVEAMAAGLPVICSDVPGVREVAVGGGGDGIGTPSSAFLIDPNSPDEIADRLAQLLDDPELRNSMGHRAKQRAQSFDISKTVADHLDLYRYICLVSAS
ncbi:glycosyltransferase family 1 protein [bacterium]|nr:MAG: glycosyltransferase family 1 protein [bacterium]